MHSMVGAFSPYTVKRRQAELVRGYCYRFLQCSFPCGVVMIIFSSLLIIIGSIQLIYIMHFNGCNPANFVQEETTSSEDISIKLSFKCNRQTVKVLGITFVVTGSVAFLISLLIIKYSRSSEENNVIRTTTSSLLANNIKTQAHHSTHPATSHQYHTPSPSAHDQNHVIVSVQ